MHLLLRNGVAPILTKHQVTKLAKYVTLTTEVETHDSSSTKDKSNLLICVQNFRESKQ